MNTFIPLKKPHLPTDKVKHIVASPQYPEYIKALEVHGITVLETQCCEYVMPQVSFHADMLFAHLGGNGFLVEKSQANLKKSLENLGFTAVDANVSLDSDYPDDVRLNSCILGEYLICGKNNVHPILQRGRRVMSTSQGYAKCALCVVDENSIITDDVSIYNACISKNIDALLIKKGSVRLEGFDYGFIGGCCGKLSKDTLAFCGDIKTHSDYLKINSFMRERNVYPLSLSGGELCDIGSILPITQANMK